MAEQAIETVVKEEEGAEDTLLGGGIEKTDKPVEQAAAPAETAEAKAEREANEKLLTADDKSLTAEQLAKKQTLVAEKAANSIPEGEYELKVPEGMALDAETVKALSPVFKDLKLTQGQVQKLVEAYAPQMQRQMEAASNERLNTWKEMVEGWRKETETVLGTKAMEELSFASKFIDRMSDSPEEAKALRELLNETGVGNNKLLAKVLIKAGKSISQDAVVDPAKTTVPGGKFTDIYTHPDSKATLT